MSGNNSNTPKPELIERFLSNQSKELELQSQQLAINKEKEKHDFQFAQEALKAQLADRAQAREYQRQMVIIKSVAAVVLLIVVLAFCAWAIRYDKEQLIIELGKAGLYFAAGALSSFGYGRYQRMRSEADEEHKDVRN